MSIRTRFNQWYFNALWPCTFVLVFVHLFVEICFFIYLFVWQIPWANLVINCVLISLRYRCSARAYQRAQNDFLIINRNECRAVHYIMTHGICSMTFFRAVLLYCVLCDVYMPCSPREYTFGILKSCQRVRACSLIIWRWRWSQFAVNSTAASNNQHQMVVFFSNQHPNIRHTCIYIYSAWLFSHANIASNE